MMRVASAAFFEVDAALRPEGRNGELVRTLESHIAYYQRWAKTWEFQALLKARPVVGDAELGERYLTALMPMVWRACEREDFVVEVQAMRRRVEQLVPADVRGRELKLGSGGLRDVEFAVQLLQLVHARSDESLRVASTVDALAALGEGGYIGREDAANMTASYEFLRLLEHRLQLQRLKRTHLLPDPEDEEAVRWLARGPHPARWPKRCGRGAAGGTQEAERAGVEVTHQTLLSTAAGIDRPDRVGDRPRHDVGGRGAGWPRWATRTADRVETHVGVGQSKRPARTGAVGAAAQAAGLDVVCPRSRRRTAGLPAAQ